MRLFFLPAERHDAHGPAWKKCLLCEVPGVSRGMGNGCIGETKFNKRTYTVITTEASVTLWANFLCSIVQEPCTLSYSMRLNVFIHCYKNNHTLLQEQKGVPWEPTFVVFDFPNARTVTTASSARSRDFRRISFAYTKQYGMSSGCSTAAKVHMNH